MGDKTFGTLIHVEMMKRRVNGNLDNILENMTQTCVKSGNLSPRAQPN